MCTPVCDYMYTCTVLYCTIVLSTVLLTITIVVHYYTSNMGRLIVPHSLSLQELRKRFSRLVKE